VQTATSPATQALLVIDLQGGAFDGVRVPAIDGAEALLENARALIAAAHAAQVPVVCVQHGDEADQAFERGTAHGQFHARLAPQPGEPVIHKLASSAFEDTALHGLLTRLGIQGGLLCGLQSEFCVSITARSALALGYAVGLVQDGHSTWPSGGRLALATADPVDSEPVKHLLCADRRSGLLQRSG
jgi:nicotinamidase-related amidase